MMQKTTTERLSEELLENKIEQAFDGLWDLGVLGVKVVISESHVKVSAYLLSNAEIDDVSPAIGQITNDLRERFTIEESIIHGVVPASRIRTQIAA